MLKKRNEMRLEDAIETTFKNEYHKLFVNIMYTGNMLRDLMKNLLKSKDLLPQHYNALRIINGKFPEPANPGGIRKVLLDKANDVTRLLDKLVEKDYISRNICPTNRRKIDIYITPKGQLLLEELQAEVEAMHKNFQGVLGGEEAEYFNTMLDKIKSAYSSQ
jgi:DNA-binding MarR family transcriptional regulator